MKKDTAILLMAVAFMLGITVVELAHWYDRSQMTRPFPNELVATCVDGQEVLHHWRDTHWVVIKGFGREGVCDGNNYKD